MSADCCSGTRPVNPVPKSNSGTKASVAVLRFMSPSVCRSDDGNANRIQCEVRSGSGAAVALEQSLGANLAQSAFFANISQETRTPMNGCLGMTQRLLDTERSDQHRNFTATTLSADEGRLRQVLNNSSANSRLAIRSTV
ncbi:MAG: hypothetical protein GWP91_07825 [Rhodobacterales bacterium]|nr:hypothetical protein [Rhodobacterales bacterium]